MLKKLFEENEKLSLKCFAEALGLGYQPTLKQSKKPIANEVYDPKATNYEALEAYVAKKLGEDYEAIINDIDWAEVVANKAVARNSSLLKDTKDINIGDKVYLRIDKTTPFVVIYTTSTHVVIMKEGTEEPISWSWNTFFFKGPQKEPRVATEEEM